MREPRAYDAAMSSDRLTSHGSPPSFALGLVTLGATGLVVSSAGLGCGGHSRLGLAGGGSEADAELVVRAALERGVTLVDTAPAYGTEAVVGRAIAGRRDEVVVSTKVSVRTPDGTRVDPATIPDSVAESLRRLGTDRVDVLLAHGIQTEDLTFVREHVVPQLIDLRDRGMTRSIGATEWFSIDPLHLALRSVVVDDPWPEVVMTGYNLLNQSARTAVMEPAAARGIGVLVMYAVRRSLTDVDRFQAVVDALADDGEIDRSALESFGPMRSLLDHPGVVSLTDAAYRFARHEPGGHPVLFGTGNTAHLDANLSAMSAEPLPRQLVAQLEQLFGRVSSATGD